VTVEIDFGLTWEMATDGDGPASPAVELGFDTSPWAIIPLGNQKRISKQPEAINTPSLSDGAFATGAAASTEGTS
jgi:hypothetical protein